MFVREKVIKAILDSGENFMSGEQLSKKLGISRTAVWKHINALREEGYNIESVNKKGYRLAEKPDDILSSENIAYNLPTEFIGKKVIHLDTAGPMAELNLEVPLMCQQLVPEFQRLLFRLRPRESHCYL